jgi:hypothetical protein
MAGEQKSSYGATAMGSLTGMVSNVAHGGGSAISRFGHAVGGAGESAMRAASSLKSAGLDPMGKLGGGYGKALGFYDRLFYKDINKDFGDHLEVASRGACFVVMCAIPFVVPSEICPSCNDIVQQGYFTAMCVTYFIYTLYLYTGDILHFAQGGIMGTVIAVFNIWCMQGFMPGGYTESMPHRWYLGNLWGIMFTFLVLWLNFDDNTRIFGLSTYVWYWMAFIKPDATAGFSQNFEVRLNGSAMKEFGIAVVGCGIAVVAAYVPYPIYAHTKALDTAKRMVTQVYMTKQDFVGFYCGDKKNQMAIQILSRELETLRSEAGTIAGLLDTAWYECLGLGKWQKQRVMMGKFSDYSLKSVDLMSNVFQICQSETFDKDHVTTMQQIKEPLAKLIDSNSEVLKYCLAGLYEAGFTDDVKELAEAELANAMEGVKTMTANLERSRAETGYNKISEDSSGENVAALTFSKFTHLTREFYNSLQGEQQEVRSWRDGAGLLGLFEPGVLFEKDHMTWTLRNGVSIILSFFIGWHGYNQYIASYNAAIASTVAVLLSKFVGSAMVKNLARLQGVVIGIVLGNLLYAFLAWCYWWGHLLVAIALYLWTLMGLFMYFHSANYSTVGLLLAVFGSQSLLKPCANTDTDPSGHSAIVNVTIGICVMTIIDLLLSPARASDMTKANFKHAYTSIIDVMDNLFDPSQETIEPRGGALSGAIGAAASMGNEAALEPRYWRHDWPTSKFNQAIACLQKCRFCLDSIENIVLKDGKKSALFQDVTRLPECLEVKKVLHDHAMKVMESVGMAIEDLAGNDVFIQRLGEIEPDNLVAIKTFGSGTAALDKLCDALNTGDFGEKYMKAKSVEDISEDPLADCSLVVESLKAMFGSLDETLESVVS